MAVEEKMTTSNFLVSHGMVGGWCGCEVGKSVWGLLIELSSCVKGRDGCDAVREL